MLSIAQQTCDGSIPERLIWPMPKDPVKAYIETRSFIERCMHIALLWQGTIRHSKGGGRRLSVVNRATCAMSVCSLGLRMFCDTFIDVGRNHRVTRAKNYGRVGPSTEPQEDSVLSSVYNNEVT